MTKEIILTGGSGLLGTQLTKTLIDSNYQVTVVTRNLNAAKKKNPFASRYILWDYKNSEGLIKELEGKHAVIHLAGANLYGKRWTKSYKKILYNSRIETTKNLVSAMQKLNEKPDVFICASGINYYGDSGDKILTEDFNNGHDFLAKLTSDWENEASKAEPLGMRWISIRNGIVLSKEGGALKVMLPLFKSYIGGALGNGRQWFPWIHIEDTVNIFKFAIENGNIKGPVNAVSPNPVRMNEFVKTLGKVLSRPSVFKVPNMALRIVLGEFGKYITASLRATPQKLLDSGFKFQNPELQTALENLIKKN